MKKEQKMEQQPNTDSTADNSQVSPTCPKPIVMRCLLGVKCPRCDFGRVYYNHSEPHGWTTVEVYKCNKCFTEFV